MRQQLRAERQQHALSEAQLKQEIAIQARELAEVRYQLARRDARDALAAAPCASQAVH
jgi:hypothetical protein